MKQSSIHRRLCYILQGILFLELLIALWRGNWLPAFTASGIIGVTLIPFFVERRVRVHIPPQFQLMGIAFVFASLFLGEMRGYYTRFWWWDIVLHTSSGFLLGIVGFLLVHVLNEIEKIGMHLKPGFVSLFAFLFAVGLGALWEIFEFTMDTFFGTNMIFVGTEICPYPVSGGDNAIFSEGWPQAVSNDHYGLLSVIATTPIQVDSIVIRHARTTNGPHRLRVSYSPSPMEPFYEIADEYVDWNFEETVITDLGCLEIPAGTPYSTFQLKVQAYDATGDGSWALDEVRIAGSTCSTFSTAIPEREWNDGEQNVQYFDVLGRPVSGNVAPGVYSGGRRVITVH